MTELAFGLADRPQRDVVEVVLGFARTLRHAGVAASPDRVEAMLAAVGHLDVLDPTDVYWSGRLTLCGSPDDLDRYDAAFAAYFAGEAPRKSRTSARQEQRLAESAPLSASAGSGEENEEAPDLQAAASEAEVLRTRDVSELTVAERDQLRRLFALLVPAAPMRPSRRRRPDRHGSVDMARTIRHALHDGGEITALRRRRPRPRPAGWSCWSTSRGR
ncbi:hypothetical protein ACFQX8_23485 [Klenkia terrae]|uniref:hypothetical protein n=1 Tax=Klenkia terrae TaxID=1052259 RepID=UPI00361115FC